MFENLQKQKCLKIYKNKQEMSFLEVKFDAIEL